MPTAKNIAWLFLVLLSVTILFCLGAELVTLTQPILKNYNEGWNAYLIDAAIKAPATLYPGANSLFTNNYPPLSFFVVGSIARLTGDAILAGRIIAFLATLGTGICLAFAARAIGCAWRQAGLAALLFWAAPWVIVRFSALNDPQMLGDFFDAFALVVILSDPRDLGHVLLSALFLTFAEFVKPLFIALPIAVVIWLFVYERRSAFWLMGAGLLFAMAGYVLTALTLHADLFHYLFSSRLYFWSRLTGQPGQWLLVEALPFAASLALFRGKDSHGFFAALYAAIAFAMAVIFSGGDGVSASQMMDVSMAVAFGAALFVQRAGAGRWTIPGVAFVAGLQTLMLGLSFVGLFASRPSLPDLMGSRYATRYDMNLIGRQKAPVMCETLALCYWGSQARQVDVFGMTQQIARGARPASDFTKLLDAHAFRMIQLQPGSRLFPPSLLWDAVVRNYYLEHEDRNGMFLIPRDQPLTGLPGIFRR